MVNYVAPGNEKLMLVIDDLQKEHTRWAAALVQIKTLIESTQDRQMPIYQEMRNRAIELEAKVEFLELLIRRYRSWRL